MSEQTDVLVVGAGPAGLATAIGLAQAGMDFITLDALGEAENTSRAAVIHAATLETLERLGVADRLIAKGVRVPEFRVRDRDKILLEADFSELPGPMPFALMIPQDETEAILAERLEQFGHRVRRPARLVDLERVQDRVKAKVSGGEGERTIEARFIVGADGEKSTVRACAGINFPGETYGSFLLADVHMDWPIPTSEVSLFFAEAGTLVIAPMSGARFRVVAQLANAPPQPSAADVQRVMDERGPGRGARIRDVIWGSRFQVHHKLADRFREGPFVLVGDAAHVHSPAGGQGMNLGLRDAEVLAAALTASLRNQKDELNEYARLRRASAELVLARTDRLTKLATAKGRSIRCARDLALVTAGRSHGVRKRVASMLAGYT